MRLLLALLFIVILAAGGFYFYQTNAAADSDNEKTVSEMEPAEGASAANPGLIDVEAALSERVLGNPEAPVKISEHASLTCTHCGDFHRKTFDQFQKAYIDSGKAYLVFSDFPLNGPALHAAMAARCLPHDKYFDFIHMLFETQDKWAFDKNYMMYLKEKAMENGLSADEFKACVQNEDLQKGILQRMKTVQTLWNVNSTPSFVVNNKIVISGAAGFDKFSEEIDSAIEDSQAE